MHKPPAVTAGTPLNARVIEAPPVLKALEAKRAGLAAPPPQGGAPPATALSLSLSVGHMGKSYLPTMHPIHTR